MLACFLVGKRRLPRLSKADLAVSADDDDASSDDLDADAGDFDVALDA